MSQLEFQWTASIKCLNNKLLQFLAIERAVRSKVRLGTFKRIYIL